MAGLGRVGAYAWLDHVRLVAIRGDTAVLTAVPGRREVAAFATEARLARVATELSGIVGRPLRARLDLTPPGGSDPASRRPDPADAGHTPGRGDAPDPDGMPGRREALSLPLVRQVLEAFPDATLIGVRRRDEPAPGPPTPAEPEPPDPADAEIDDEELHED